MARVHPCACAGQGGLSREGGGRPAPALQPAQPRGPTLAAGRAVCHMLDCFRNSQEINLGGWEGTSVYPRCAEVTQSESASGLRPHCQPAGRGSGVGGGRGRRVAFKERETPSPPRPGRTQGGRNLTDGRQGSPSAGPGPQNVFGKEVTALGSHYSAHTGCSLGPAITFQ